MQLKNQPASILPGGITYIAGQNNIGMKPIYQINPPVQEIMLDIQALQLRISNIFFNDLFQMISQLNTVRSATEIDARREEKLVLLGPVLERFENEALGKAIDRTSELCSGAGCCLRLRRLCKASRFRSNTFPCFLLRSPLPPQLQWSG